MDIEFIKLYFFLYKIKILLQPNLSARFVDCNDDYIGIGMDITRNAKCYNVIIIPIQLFGNPIVIES